LKVSRNTPILSYLDSQQSVLILGPRGSGKSFYIQSIIKEFKHIEINLLDQEEYILYLNNPDKLQNEITQKLKTDSQFTVFIDEVQRIPRLLNDVHLIIEKYQSKITFILTGSSARKIKRGGGNLLAGRALLVHFSTFSFNEVDLKSSLNQVLQYGLLPTAFLANNDDIRIAYLKTYTAVYLKEEIQQEAIVRQIDTFSQFLEVAAFSNGEVVNFSKIAKVVSSTSKTIKEYFQILEDTLIAKRIPAWNRSIRKQLQQAPKYYFFDNGVINALTGELRSELKSSSYRYGRLFENLVICEILKLNENFDYKIYHYRTNHGNEIDLIIEKNAFSEPLAVEIKSATSPSIQDVKELVSFKQEFPNSKVIVLCNCPRAYTEGEVSFFPFLEGMTKIFEFVE
jgi:uncharacterized protein